MLCHLCSSVRLSEIYKGWTSMRIVQKHARVVTLHLCRPPRPEVQQT